MATVKLMLGDKEVEGEKVEFKAVTEPWNSYLLSDGTAVKLKVVVTEIYKLVGQFDPITKAPQYMIKSSNIASVELPGTTKGDH